MKYPLVELRFGELIGRTFILCGDCAKFLAVLAIIPLISGVAATLVIHTYLPKPVMFTEQAPEVSRHFFAESHLPFSLTATIILATSLASAICYGAAAWGVTQRYIGAEVSVRDSFRAAWDNVGRVLVVAILSGLGVTLGLFLCFVPGMYLGLVWFIVYPALLFEGVGAMQSMRRSCILMEGQKLKVFVIMIVFSLVTGSIGGLIQCLPSSLTLIKALVSGTESALHFAFTSVLAVVVYFSARSRMEPITMETLDQLSANDTEGTPDIAAG